MTPRHAGRTGRGPARPGGRPAATDLAQFLLDRYREDEQAGRELWPGEARALAAVVQRCLRGLEQHSAGCGAYERALRQFGSRYAHHPHYRCEWRP